MKKVVDQIIFSKISKRGIRFYLLGILGISLAIVGIIIPII